MCFLRIVANEKSERAGERKKESLLHHHHSVNMKNSNRRLRFRLLNDVWRFFMPFFFFLRFTFTKYLAKFGSSMVSEKHHTPNKTIQFQRRLTSAVITIDRIENLLTITAWTMYWPQIYAIRMSIKMNYNRDEIKWKHAKLIALWISHQSAWNTAQNMSIWLNAFVIWMMVCMLLLISSNYKYSCCISF